MSPSLDLPPKGGFNFDLCRRNAMLENKGLKAPTFLKTGTTIVGLVFQVWNLPFHRSDLFVLFKFTCSLEGFVYIIFNKRRRLIIRTRPGERFSYTNKNKEIIAKEKHMLFLSMLCVKSWEGNVEK